MMYTITGGNGIFEATAFEKVRGSKKAAEMAKAMTKTYDQVYVEFHRKSDGQTGYLNPDGNHDITGKNWRE